VKRRDFISLVGGAAVLPLAARAQQAGRSRKVAALWPFNEADADGQAVFAAFREGLNELGWADVRIESRWADGNIERTRTYAAELVGLSPDVIFAYFNAQLGPLSRETRTIPIVFVGASDPLAPDTWRASPIRAATSPASRFTNRRWPAKGSAFSRRSRPD
jgi:putative ABC transport system substrate-binding protein